MARFGTKWRHPDDQDHSMVRDWLSGGLFRPGKTKHEHASGVHVQHLKNREERRKENQKKAGTHK